MADAVRDWRLRQPGIHTHTREVHREALPADVVARIEALEAGVRDLSAAAAQLSAQIAAFMTKFASHVHPPSPEMEEIAHRVQALEIFANRRAA